MVSLRFCVCQLDYDYPVFSYVSVFVSLVMCILKRLHFPFLSNIKVLRFGCGMTHSKLVLRRYIADTQRSLLRLQHIVFEGISIYSYAD